MTISRSAFLPPVMDGAVTNAARANKVRKTNTTLQNIVGDILYFIQSDQMFLFFASLLAVAKIGEDNTLTL